MDKKTESNLTIAVAVFSILIILALSFLFYYYAVKSMMFSETASLSGAMGNTKEKESVSWRTKVIVFKPSEVFMQQQKEGECFSSSIADPFRQDAFRCQVKNEIYDPCFTTENQGAVFCQLNPSVPEAFLIKLEKPLPKASALEFTQDNWAWFVKLRDGTYCSPFTGIRPIFAEDQTAYYGCKSDNENEYIVLMGDLTAGDVWTANKAIFAKEGDNWVIKSLEQVEADTVWQ